MSKPYAVWHSTVSGRDDWCISGLGGFVVYVFDKKEWAEHRADEMNQRAQADMNRLANEIIAERAVAAVAGVHNA